MQFMGKDAAIKNSIHKDLEGRVKAIGPILKAINDYRQNGWKTLKAPGVMLLPTFAGTHLKAFSRMTSICNEHFGDNHFFNMCLRMSDAAYTRAGLSHLNVAAKRQAIMEAFVEVQKSVLSQYADQTAEGVGSMMSDFFTVHKTVARKDPGFENHLKKFSDMISWCYTLAMLLDEASTLMHQNASYPTLLDEMVIYYQKVNDQKEEAILA